MKGKKILIAVVVIVALGGIIKLMAIAFLEPWLENQIEVILKEKAEEYEIDIDKVGITFFNWEVELKRIHVRPRAEVPAGHELQLEIASVKIKGIDLYNLLTKEEVEIHEIVFSEGRLKGEIPEIKEEKVPMISSTKISIDKIRFQRMDFEIRNFDSPQIYTVKGTTFNVYNLKIAEKDTIHLDIVNEFDFKVESFTTLLDDSLYTLHTNGIVYTARDKKLKIENLILHPNYPDYQFVARKKYQTDCVRAIFKQVTLNDFSAENFLKHQELVSSYLEVEAMNMHVFRDKRKDFLHKVKPMFQDLLYDYPGKLRLDSIGLKDGSVMYVEHVEQAIQPGFVKFTRINAKVYNIDNDSIYRSKEKYLEIKGSTYLMGRAKMTIGLKAKLYDPRNTIAVNGSLSSMEASAVNPMLEKNAFLYVTSGNVKSINFTFTADKYKAHGNLIMLYDGLDVAVKSKKTNDTTALKEKVISLVANKRIKDSNPEMGEETRIGIIEYERDPEKFLFNYCFKSILTGLKSSLSKPSKSKSKKEDKGKRNN